MLYDNLIMVDCWDLNYVYCNSTLKVGEVGKAKEAIERFPVEQLKDCQLECYKRICKEMNHMS